MKRINTGSILIVVLWILVLMAMMAASLGMRARMQAKLNAAFDRDRIFRLEAISAVNVAAYYINQDEDPFVDSTADMWYGSSINQYIAAESNPYSITITDEESKINLNKASPQVLESCLQTFRKHGVKLQTKPDDIVSSISAWRGAVSSGGTALGGATNLGFTHKHAPFESVDELRLIQYIAPQDVDLIKPFFTVYGSRTDILFKINLNTVHPWILEGIVMSLNGGESESRELLFRIERYRSGDSTDSTRYPKRVFDGSVVQSTANFLRMLELPESETMLALSAKLLRFITVDSQYYEVQVRTEHTQSITGKLAIAILGPLQPVLTKEARGRNFSLRNRINAMQNYPFEILSWTEGVIWQ